MYAIKCSNSILPLFEISYDLFEKVVADCEEIGCIEKVSEEEFKVCRKGFSPKSRAFWYETPTERYFAGRVNMVTPFFKIKGYDNNDFYAQGVFRCMKDKGARNVVQRTINGRTAYNLVHTQIVKRITQREYETRLESFERVYNAVPLHIYPCGAKGKVLRFPNCIYIDMNGAHADAVREAFPEISEYIEKGYKKRHDNPAQKCIPNYFVGFCKNLEHDGFYNWVVQRTREKLMSKIDELMTDDSLIVYANTDGAIIQNPKYIPISSKELGEFKIEYAGEVLAYKHIAKNSTTYSIIQYGDIIKGNASNLVREHIDLRKGLVCDYKIVKMPGEAAKIERITDIWLK